MVLLVHGMVHYKNSTFVSPHNVQTYMYQYAIIDWKVNLINLCFENILYTGSVTNAVIISQLCVNSLDYLLSHLPHLGRHVLMYDFFVPRIACFAVELI